MDIKSYLFVILTLNFKPLIKMIKNFVVLFLLVKLVTNQEPEKGKFGARFSQGVEACPDFENKLFDLSDLVAQTSDECHSMKIGGDILISKLMDSEYNVCLGVHKSLEMGTELVYSACGDFCSCVQDTEAPWYPVTLAMNCTECPVEPAEYPLNGVSLSFGFAKEVLTRDFVGDYVIHVIVTDGDDVQLSCYKFFIAVVELEDDEEDENC